MKVPYTITADAVSVLVNNRMRVVSASMPNFAKLAAALRLPEHDLDLIADLADITRFIARATFGRVQIADNQVRWDGKKVGNVIADRLLGMLAGGHDLEPLARFLDRLMDNPLESAREELYLWLESENAPITPDGFFLAFKAVRPDYKDKHTGTFDNSVGAIPSMPREQVDPDRTRKCSRGLHFCSHGYLGNFASPGDPIMIVKIDPADVVAIPHDYHNQKGRAWRYEVVGEVPQDETATFFHGRPVVQVYSPPASSAVFPLKDESVFSVGDIAIFQGGSSLLKLGEEYNVLDVRSDDDPMVEDEIQVCDDDGDEYFYPVTYFTKKVEAPEVVASDPFPFAIGDEVECLDDEDGYTTIGDTYTVVDVDPDDDVADILVTDDDGGNSWVQSCHFGKVEPALSHTEVVVPPAAEEPATTTAELIFHAKGTKRSYFASEVLSLIEEHGQRGASRLTGVPRTTLQEWVKEIKAA
jgi:hypothetical protein